MIQIQLSKGYVASIDNEDEHLTNYKWHANVTKKDKKIYARRTWWSGGKQYYQYLHRAVFDSCHADYAKIIDHIDGNTLNCSRANLRGVNWSQSNVNKHTYAASGFKGVREGSKTPGRWLAQIATGKKQIHIGTYASPEEAALAYDSEARKIFGEFATVNFPIGKEQSAIRHRQKGT